MIPMMGAVLSNCLQGGGGASAQRSAPLGRPFENGRSPAGHERQVDAVSAGERDGPDGGPHDADAHRLEAFGRSRPERKKPRS